MYNLGFGWEVERETKRVAKQILPKLKTLDYSYDEVYGFAYKNQNFMKPILDETRHLGLLINYNTLDLY